MIEDDDDMLLRRQLYDAMVDVEATMRCFLELVKRDVIQIETNNVMRLF